LLEHRISEEPNNTFDLRNEERGGVLPSIIIIMAPVDQIDHNVLESTTSILRGFAPDAQLAMKTDIRQGNSRTSSKTCTS